MRSQSQIGLGTKAFTTVFRWSSWAEVKPSVVLYPFWRIIDDSRTGRIVINQPVLDCIAPAMEATAFQNARDSANIVDTEEMQRPPSPSGAYEPALMGKRVDARLNFSGVGFQRYTATG